VTDPREIVMPLMRWWGETPIGLGIRKYSALIALLQSIHLLGLTMLGGTLLVLNLRLFGFGFVRIPVARLGRELAPWTAAGLTVSISTGILILSSEARKCYESSFFWIKMGLLITALTFQFTIYRSAIRSEVECSPRSRSVAVASCVLWLGVALCGKLIGIYGDDLRQQEDPFHRIAEVTRIRSSIQRRTSDNPGIRLRYVR
jgi:hypothetical protein